MNSKEKLSALRQEIDRIDDGMVKLFGERMNVSADIASVKAEGNIALVDHSREQRVIERALAATGEDNRFETVSFMQAVMALSKIRQSRVLAIPTAADFPASASWKADGVTVGFQGVSGAWSEHGASQLFPSANLQSYEYFEDVFEAVKSGKTDYGVLPIENSTTGAIGEVYDLLRRHSCYIVGEVWISIAQCLLGTESAALSDIREVFSHPEGFNQSRRFLKGKSWDLTVCRNTAVAAQTVAEKNSPKYAAIGSRRAAMVHGLKVLAPDIMDSPNNKTRFIAIAAKPIYDRDCTATSITFSTAHRSGALCAVLQSFMLANINLTRIDSRPVSQESYRFFADLDANILDESTMNALRQAATQCDYFEILGCYPRTVEI